ncbi:DUF2975 domain-containing protein [Cryobacterium roopkundense]|uniref:ABC transporter n=1 Tax=Cryobacterium roopkundense TaxID=1001240 RepID=A0A7W8ZZ59_9MICO|nr:DUF2975 domain-containing protein [Cryobacterium roopkundense]MBB5642748.1 hypothetical protein [Cryobacterium roopkundense]
MRRVSLLRNISGIEDEPEHHGKRFNGIVYRYTALRYSEDKMTVVTARFVRFLLTLLVVFSFLIEVVFVPLIGQSIISDFPEARPFFIPAFVWVVLIMGCGQAILVVVWRLISFVVERRIFTAAALPWVRAIIVISVGALTLLISAFIVANILGFTPPAAMYGLIGLSLLCLTFVLIMRTMLGLLRRATALHDELAEVI